MTKLIPPANPGWPDVTRYEVTERLLGGDGGPLNRAPLELLERTEFLKKKIDDAVSGALTFEYANRLKTARSIAMTGDGSWAVVFDGSGNVSAVMTLADTGVAAGTYPVVTVDSKGRATAGRALVATDIPALDWSKITSGKPTTVAGYGITDGATKTDATNAAPSGAVAYFAMSAAPTGWLKANGAAVSRTTYVSLFNAITLQTTGNTTNGSNSVAAVGSTTGIANGMPISGPGIPSGTTVTAFTANTITMSANATATANGVALVVAPFGVGDGLTTFNLPDLRGEFLRGLDDGRGVDSGRSFGSWQADALKSHNHVINSWDVSNTAAFYINDNGGDSIVSSDNIGNNGTYRPNRYYTEATGAAETRPRNVAMLACIKF